MNEDKYKVYIDDEVVAENMDIETANILIKALWSTYYNDPTMTIKIEKMTKLNDCDCDSAAKTSSSPAASAAEEIYPLTVIHDRYNGTYSGGKFTAWNHYEAPDEVWCDDTTCSEFWEHGVSEYIVGVGDTIEDAINDLVRCIKLIKEGKGYGPN